MHPLFPFPDKFSLILLLASVSAFSEDALKVVAEDSEGNAYNERAKARESQSSSVAYESVDKENLPVHKERWSDFLPILGKQARAEGYVLPRPFGVSIIGLTQEQPFEVTRIGLDLDGMAGELVNSIVEQTVTASDLHVSDTTFNLRFDAWIFPFLNVYGLMGETRGRAELNVNVDMGFNPLLTGVVPGLPNSRADCDNLGLPSNNANAGGIIPAVTCMIQTSVHTKLDFHGTVLGYGTTIAGGYGDFFGMFDVNYSEADVNIAKDNTEQTVYSTRIGWNGSMGIWSGQLWVGGMKQDIKQTLFIVTPIPLGNGDTLGVEIDQHASSPYNYLVGGTWNITPAWEIVAESSFLFSERQQFMLQGSYRF